MEVKEQNATYLRHMYLHIHFCEGTLYMNHPCSKSWREKSCFRHTVIHLSRQHFLCPTCSSNFHPSKPICNWMGIALVVL